MLLLKHNNVYNKHKKPVKLHCTHRQYITTQNEIYKTGYFVRSQKTFNSNLYSHLGYSPKIVL